MDSVERLLSEWGDSVREAAAMLGGLKQEMQVLRDEVRRLRREIADMGRDFADTTRTALDGPRAALDASGTPVAGTDESGDLAGSPSRTSDTWQDVIRLRDELEEDPESVPRSVISWGETVETELQPFDASGGRRRIGEILVDAGILTPEQLEEALREQVQAPHRRLGAILVERGYTGETVVGRVLAAQLRTRFVSLDREPIDAKAAALIGARMARHHACLPISADDEHLVLAMANPFDLIAVDDVEMAAGRRAQCVVAASSDIAAAIDRVYGAAG